MAGDGWVLRSVFTLVLAASLASARGGDAILVGDAHVVESGANATTKYGTKASLSLREGRSVFVAFDLSTLPGDVTADRIAKANLRLFVNKVKSPGTFAVRALVAPFEETKISGSNAPPFLTSAFDPIGLPLVTDDKGRERVIDVTALVKAWVAGGITNEGLTLIADAGSGIDASFASREGDSGNKPRLEIEVDPPPAAPITSKAVHGQGFAPAVLAATPNFAFVTGATATIAVAAGESLVVVASAALGTTNAAGSGDAAFDIGIRPTGSLDEPSVPNNEFQLLRVAQNDRIPVTLTRVIAGLPPGEYEVGLVYRTNSTAWNNNDTSRCVVFTLPTE